MNLKKKRKKKVRKHQFALINNKVWRTLLKENRVDKIYRSKVRSIYFISYLTTPLRWLQRALFARKIKQINLQENPPLFILGHWRSGTTHMHYTFDKDPQFGTLTNYQTFLFSTSLLSKRFVKFLLSPLMPKERTQDNVKMSVDKPGEEEQPFATISTRTGFHSWIFPKNLSYFNKYNVFKGISTAEKKAWQKDYTSLLQTISYFNGGNKPLLLKNPHNTGRVKELLELFPKAKFVFIHRHPLDVYLSTVHLYSKVIETQFLQYATLGERKKMIIYFFKETLQKYLAEKDMIPKGQLYEVGFDEFTGNEMHHIEKIYSELNIPNFEKAKPHIQQYLDSVKSYKKNKFRNIEPEVEAHLRKEWQFAFETWGYE